MNGSRSGRIRLCTATRTEPAILPHLYRLMTGLFLRAANDLGGLVHAEEKTLWVRHESGPQSIHIWAPEIHYLFGGWYIYYAAGDKDDIWNIRPYVLHCKGQNPMKDEWEELGMMQAADSDEFFVPCLFSGRDGVLNTGENGIISGRKKTGVGRQISNLYIGKMAAANKLCTDQVLLTTPDYDWERVDFWVNEGPAI